MMIDATGQCFTVSRTDAAGADPVGLARRVEHLIDRLPAAVVETEDKIERTHNQLEAATARIGLAFERQPELSGLQRRMEEIEAVPVNRLRSVRIAQGSRRFPTTSAARRSVPGIRWA